MTIPAGIRKKLNLKEGDKVIFIEKDGQVVIDNSSMVALKKVQDAFLGEAERLGLRTEEDVVALVKEVRKDPYSKQGVTECE